jgi:putative endonuclease
MKRPKWNQRRGREGERRAEAYLRDLGYQIVGRNVRLPYGELDLVCVDGATLVFVEVKARSAMGYGSALSAVDSRKRTTLRRLGADYAQIIAPGARFRFDVVAVDGERIALYRNAF